MKIRKAVKNNRGVALPWALFALALVMITGGIFTKSINNEIILNRSNIQREQARYAAESGIHELLYFYTEVEETAGHLVNSSYTSYIESNIIYSTGKSDNKTVKMQSSIGENGAVTYFKVVYEE